MSTAVADYTARRGELLADLVLTRNKDIQVIRFDNSEEMGFDFLARILRPVGSVYITSSFGVQILATSDPLVDEKSATKYVNSRGKHRSPKGSLFCPIMVMLFSMEGDEGYWGWRLEPNVNKESGPTLARVKTVEMKKITKKSIDEIVRRAEAWFVAVLEMLQRSDDEKS